ncbi:MAG: universal stress protein [Streptosporangiaceae bacterium]
MNAETGNAQTGNAQTGNAQTGNVDTGNADQAAEILAGSGDEPVYAVVGFDGTAPALRALDAAVRLLTGRSGGLEIVYVTPFPVVAADLRGSATEEVIESQEVATRDLSDEVRAHLQSASLTGAAQNWSFQRRDGGAAEQLITAADELSQEHGHQARIVIVVGRPEHRIRHPAGSVPHALERHDGYPVIVVP